MKKPVGMSSTIMMMLTMNLRPSGSLSMSLPVSGATNIEMSMMMEVRLEAIWASKPSWVSRKVL